MYFTDFGTAIEYCQQELLSAPVVNRGRWQGIDTVGKPDLDTHELTNVQLSVPIPGGDEFWTAKSALELAIDPNLPWADEHFEERVGGVPMNPDPSHERWPWWRGQDAASKTEGGTQFTHTYSERFWPKHAGGSNTPATRSTGAQLHDVGSGAHYLNGGIRYSYGDLNDVVDLLVRDPFTRQATFPIFFPEDTGAVHGGRVPCTLHYHFLLDPIDYTLDIYYPIRSCDFVRHFRDDIYMACQLLLWVIERCQSLTEDRDPEGGDPGFWYNVKPGYLHFTAYSLHIHRGDLHHVVAKRA